MHYDTYPDYETIKGYFDKTPEYMFPSMNPYVVTLEGVLTPQQCDNIVEFHNDVEPYAFHGCRATTRETPLLPQDDLMDIHEITRLVNGTHWQYDIYEDQPRAWMQSYVAGQDYQLHMDGNIGQTRKLTAVALLSPEDSYRGGALEIEVAPNTLFVPKTQGTIVIFPSWILHRVAPVLDGLRQTINMGFWGPPFK